jgi:hypothetical protein
LHFSSLRFVPRSWQKAPTSPENRISARQAEFDAGVLFGIGGLPIQ